MEENLYDKILKNQSSLQGGLEWAFLHLGDLQSFYQDEELQD
ncbi:MAG: hypothetical protein PHG59_01215 [Patescibacteria group bacterium]|nr:hypothetical protein [Patescibacteria group bacterium]